MGLVWQQGPLAASSVGHFLSATTLPENTVNSVAWAGSDVCCHAA